MLGSVRTLQELVDGLAEHGEQSAVLEMAPNGGVSCTFLDLASGAKRISAELQSRGVALGEPVGILATNGTAWVTACLGILASGAAVMPLDIRQTETERNDLIASSGRRFMYTSDGPRPASLSLRRFSDSCEEPQARLLRERTVQPEDPALFMHTSGTTATPKAVVLSHANVLSNIRALVAEDLIGPGDRALLPLPLHHVYPLVVGLLLPLYNGATVVFPAGISGPEIAAALREGNVDMLVGVPRLYDALLKAIVDGVHARGRIVTWIFERLLRVSIALVRRGHDSFGRAVFRGVRCSVAPALWRLASGGAALEAQTETSLLGLGYEVLVGYGLTETSPIVTFNRSGHARIGSAGEPLPGAEVKIAHPNADGIGEIYVRGPNVFAGYSHDAAATRAAFTSDGWFRTGDLGRIDAEGYLYVEGRVSETLVLPSGEKLNPEDVERRYEASPIIREIGVFLDGGKLVGLVVSREASPQAAVRMALANSASSLPSYMQLAGFALVEEPLPRTPLGKLRRYLLPTLYRAAQSEQIRIIESLPLSPADRVLLEDRMARRIWTWLETRFSNHRLSLDMSPQLDLGVDSLEAVTLTMDLERELGITLDEAALANVVTLRDLINAAIAAKAGPDISTGTDRLAKTGVLANGIWYVGVATVRALVKILFRVRVEGIENLPVRGPYVLCPNHASYLDGPALATALPWPILRQVYWIGGVDIMFSNRFRRGFSRLAHVLPIDRAHGSPTGLALSTEALRCDRILVWFPEGWLTKDGSLQPFLPGIGSLVLDNPVPIVPVYIESTFGAWLPQHLLPRPRHVTVRFGKPLDPSRWAAWRAGEHAAESIAADIKADVAALGGSTLQYFGAIGFYYRDFTQVTDDEVRGTPCCSMYL